MRQRRDVLRLAALAALAAIVTLGIAVGASAGPLVGTPPAISSADHSTFSAGSAGTFTVTTTPGDPAATSIAESGPLPSGVTFTDNGDGTATLGGTPAAGTGGSYALTITASNGITPDSVQAFTLSVTDTPTITSANSAIFVVGYTGHFTVTTTGGFPTATTLTETGSLPSGVTFTDNGDGTATIAGDAPDGTEGNYPLTITATNSAGHTDQAFVLSMGLPRPPEITSGPTTTFTVGSPGTFTVTTSSVLPNVTIGESGTLPAGVTFTDNGDGTATLAGTPAAFTGGDYSITIRASNGEAPDATEPFTLHVNQPPVIVSPDHTTFEEGRNNSFDIEVFRGNPTATTISHSGGIPTGIDFHDNRDGTATISGMPPLGTGGIYTFTLTASNGVQPDSVQAFTLTVTEAPSFNSADHTTFNVGSAGSFTATTHFAYPAGTSLTETGALPSGVTFTDNGDGTATLAGTATTGTVGDYPLTLTATNSAGHTDQAFTLTVGKGSQSINFPALADKFFGTAPFAVSATASSGLAVSFSSDTTSVCTVSGNTVTPVTAGTCTIRAGQAGDADYLPAPDVTQSFVVGYTVSSLAPPNKSTFQHGSAIPVRFQLTGAGGVPLPAALAASLGCHVTIRFDGAAPVCAVYNRTTNYFQATIKTAGSKAGQTYPLTIVVTASDSTVIATKTEQLTAK